MGLFHILFEKSKNQGFTPNFELSEFDNLLDYIDKGGSEKKWDRLKSVNCWIFKEDDTEIFKRYEAEIKPISNKYFLGLHKLESEWSILYNLKEYTGARADSYIVECNKNINLYKQMIAIERKYGYAVPPNVPAYKRLSMIYEKRGLFDKSIEICKDALINGAYGDGMDRRLIKMIKKSGRQPTPEEVSLSSALVR